MSAPQRKPTPKPGPMSSGSRPVSGSAASSDHPPVPQDAGVDSAAAALGRLAVGSAPRATAAPPPSAVNGVPYVFVDSVPALADATAALTLLAAGHGLAVDLEGVNLGRTGEIATVQLCGEPRGTTYIVDVTTLGSAAFEEAGGLRRLLEDVATRKLFWDVRCDANALFHHFDVAMPPESVVDLQLLDLANATLRGRTMTKLGSLGWLLDNTNHGGLSPAEARRMSEVKAAARGLFAPELGGSYAAWLERPLSPTLLEYATDCRYFHAIRDSLAPALAGPHVDAALADAVRRRIDLACSLAFSGDDRASNVRVDAALVDALSRATDAGRPGRDRRGDGFRGFAGGAHFY